MKNQNRNRRRALAVLRVGFSVGLLAWAVARVGHQNIWQISSRADLRIVFYGFLLFNAGVVIRTLRWSVLLRGYGHKLDFPSLLILNYGGTFFNNFLPTGFGGDLLRMAEVGEFQRERKDVLAGVVVLDRYSGFLGLFTLCLIALPISGDMLPGSLAAILFKIAGAGFFGTILLIGGRPLFLRLLPFTKSLIGEKVSGYLSDAITEFPPGYFAAAWLISIAFHGVVIVVHFLSSRALGANIPFALFGVFMPIVSLTLLLPSIQGLGFRENLYGYLVAQIDSPESLGVSIGLMIYAINFATGILGGLIYLAFGLNRVIKENRLGAESGRP